MGDFWDQRVFGVGISQQRADAEEHLGDGEGRAPLVLEDVETDASVGVDVRVVDSGAEGDFRRLERIVDREVDVQEEQASSVRRVVLG